MLVILCDWWDLWLLNHHEVGILSLSFCRLTVSGKRFPVLISQETLTATTE